MGQNIIEKVWIIGNKNGKEISFKVSFGVFFFMCFWKASLCFLGFLGCHFEFRNKNSKSSVNCLKIKEPKKKFNVKIKY